jgi:hypothetical protein
MKFLTQKKIDKLQALIDDNNGIIDRNDIIPLLKSYKKQLLIQRVSNCFGKDDLRHVYEDVDTDFKNFEDWFKEYTLPI